MNLMPHATFLPHTGADASLAAAEVAQEPAARWGACDGVFRDPAGNLVRIDEVP
ncbi:hypothetical protein ACFU7T_03325 [Streptomyces sp. NPDC057555]|uniref:hypothetical protein n=1 Tax=Streptomyces sp. NPDC057555 TaxID=3346166 RepID=UPI0036834A94